MTDIQGNREPKKIFLTKPIEQPGQLANEPTTSITSRWKPMGSISGDAVRIPPRRHITPLDRGGEEYLSNHKKQRYWNSWEELFLVELWRRYKDELTIVNVPLPVYRKMMVAMRNRNMMVTAQDCRRKINTLNTKYKQELSRIESTGCKSDWRLFPLVHCVMQPKIKEFDPWQETKVIKKLLEKIPKPKEIEVPVSNTNNSYQQNSYNPYTRSFPSNTSYLPRNPNNQTLPPVSSLILQTDSNISTNRIITATLGRPRKLQVLPFRNITAEKLEQLRQDNNRLAEQRDQDQRMLHLEEENFKCFETFIRIWTERKEMELRRIQLMSEQNVISLENEENHNVEQQLQETIITK